jgi:hypothetical protein
VFVERIPGNARPLPNQPIACQGICIGAGQAREPCDGRRDFSAVLQRNVQFAASHVHGDGRWFGGGAGLLVNGKLPPQGLQIQTATDGCVACSRTSKNSGNVLATQPGFSISIPSATRPVMAKLIAIRWSSYVWTTAGCGTPG